MGRLIRISNPDGSVTFKDSKTGEIIHSKRYSTGSIFNHQQSSILSGLLYAVGIIYFFVSLLLSFVFFSNSTSKVNEIFGEVNQTNPIAIASGINILVQGLIIMLICLALAKILNIIETIDSKE